MPAGRATSLPSSSARRGRGRTEVAAEPVASDVIVSLFDAVALLRDSLDRIYRPAGLTKPKFVVLTTLAGQAPHPSLATDLARSAGVTRATMTTVLDNLQRRGWIERRRDARDRRVIQVHITPAGCAVVAAAHIHFRKICDELIQKPETAALARLTRLCESLARDARALARRLPPFPLPSAP